MERCLILLCAARKQVDDDDKEEEETEEMGLALMRDLSARVKKKVKCAMCFFLKLLCSLLLSMKYICRKRAHATMRMCMLQMRVSLSLCLSFSLSLSLSLLPTFLAFTFLIPQSQLRGRLTRVRSAPRSRLLVLHQRVQQLELFPASLAPVVRTVRSVSSGFALVAAP